MLVTVTIETSSSVAASLAMAKTTMDSYIASRTTLLNNESMVFTHWPRCKIMIPYANLISPIISRGMLIKGGIAP